MKNIETLIIAGMAVESNIPTPSRVIDRNKATKHLMIAAKYHSEAARYIKDGDQLKAAEITYLKNCYLNLANESLKIEIYHNSEYNDVTYC